MKSIICAAILITGALAVAGYPHYNHGHDHGSGHEAISYLVVNKHEDKHDNHDHVHHVGHVPYAEFVHEGYYPHHFSHDHPVEHIEYHSQRNLQEHHGHQEDHHHNEHVKYAFKYGVKDPHSGDVKDQWESRDGDSVKGGYSVKEADGTTRLVTYTSDKKKGFEATVQKIGHAHQEHGHSHGYY